MDTMWLQYIFGMVLRKAKENGQANSIKIAWKRL